VFVFAVEISLVLLVLLGFPSMIRHMMMFLMTEFLNKKCVW